MQFTEMCKTEVRGNRVVCTVCGFSMPRRIVGDRFSKNCDKGAVIESNVHRPRTIEEYVAITHICQGCEHFTGDLCNLKKSGCRACQSASKFAQWKMSGAPCPAKPPRFDGTPLIEPAPPGQ